LNNGEAAGPTSRALGQLYQVPDLEFPMRDDDPNYPALVLGN
jgi:hypothetical protein